ncbi:ACT domain-containing protein [Chryseobacterium sp. MP_3.2]|uniref:ACT domain-containing protein n=1 Tax=Chryseobacterium sp. MP_3.2 TaxID=3071712 RepID=UPI002E07FDFA|nr:aspartokinase/homoserine dehydrogenase 1 [Chryseobacterium sp. MP_3.2]
MKKNTEITFLKSRSIIKFEGKDFLDEVGIDGRIFKALTYARISVGVISQQAAENGISVLVRDDDAENAINCLIQEFEPERKSGKVSQIYSINNVSVLGFIAKDLSKIMSELERNNIFPIILNQVAAANKINIVVTSSQDVKAKNIIEAEIFAKPKTVHLAIFGVGKVGATLIDQILIRAEIIRKRKKIDLKIIAVANSKNIAFSKEGFQDNWQSDLETSKEKSEVISLIDFSKLHQLENLIAVDNTDNKDFVKEYGLLAECGFDLVSSNKTLNTLPISEYRDFRHILLKNNKKYLYEVNVGAGLPLIDTIKLLHLSGENITRIKGVFSGSMSYIFNHFSVRNGKFSTILTEAMALQITESDPRDDLSGIDVAQKLLILARELDLSNELSDIKIEKLLPAVFVKGTKDFFLDNLRLLDSHFEGLKKNQEKDHVLRLVGELHGDLQQEKGELKVKLISVAKESLFGQLKGSDSIFEIYTDSYGENPLVIIGAGAGAKVTARGVFGDILRLSENK